MNPEREFDDFVLLEEIGSGGMGTVYRAIQKSLDRPVAVKIPDPTLEKDPSFVRRFAHEAKGAARLRHENIVQVISYGEENGFHYIAMELLDGKNLQHYLRQPLPIEIAILIFRDLCRAIAHAHENAVIHRDVKPSNVMLTKDGVVKVTDFGLARRTDSNTLRTESTQIMYTPHYASPEQAAGKPVGPQSDMYSLGVVGFELIAGDRPWAGTVTQLASLNPLVPDRAVEVINHMLVQDPAQRPSTMSNVCTDLETIVEDMDLRREKELMKQFAHDPMGVTQALRKERLRKHLTQGIGFETMGRSKIDDAVREFQRVLYLDPDNETAKEHLGRLETERRQQEIGDSERTRPVPATLRVKSKPPGARVILDEGALSKTAPAEFPDLCTGPHTLRVERGGFRAAVQEVHLEPGAELSLTVVLEPLNIAGAILANPRRAARWLVIPALAVAVLAAGAGVLEHLGKRDSGGPGQMESDPLSDRQLPGHDDTAVAPPPLTPPVLLRPIPTTPGSSTPGAGQQRFGPDPGLPGVQPPSNPPAPPVPPESLVTSPPAAPPAQVDGTLEIHAPPFAYYYIDGQRRGEAHEFASIPLPPGVHTVRIEHPEFGVHEFPPVTIESGRTSALAHDFGARGTLRVVSPPVDLAKVQLDGKSTGKLTPCILKDVPAGEHEVSVVKEGYAVAGGPQVVTVQPGAETWVTFVLTPH